ncbi:MAG: ATPase [Thermoprotei archaeon]|nr:MAG: ATPase [Thermoprotei archaeon]
MVYVAGVDGGATKTICVISDKEGKILGVGRSGPSNYHIVGIEGAKRSLREAILSAIKDACVEIKKLEVACFGLAGVDYPEDKERAQKFIEELGLAEKVVVVHDTHIALMGATAGKPGVIVIAGTGSVSAGIDEKGRYVRSGGWGYILGDEGSAYDIARRGLIAALRARDGRGKPTVLVEKFMKALNLKHLEELIRKVYVERMGATEIASLAPIVSEAASEGDEVAREILDSAGRELALLAIAVIRRLNMEDKEFPIALIGGAFRAGEPLMKAFKEEVLRVAPKAKITEPRYPPAVGALLIALQEAGVRISDSVLKNIEETLDKVRKIY